MYYRAMMGVALRKATKIIAVSHATRHDLVNLYNIDENKIVVIHRGIDIDYFRGAEDDNAAWNQVRTAFGLAGPYALYVGLVRPRKNVRRLLAAVRRLRDRIGTGFRLVMVGPTDSRFLNVAGEAAALGISDIVIQTGEVSDKILRALYRHASLVVLPSLLEGFGLPILEGMASGVPIVASDIPAHREVAGNAALLFPPHDVEALYETMYRVLTDSELADSLRARGRQAVESFSWEVCARRTFELYGEIIT
jgi:glycosyltransferase involved in cell wall biosynthesis